MSALSDHGASRLLAWLYLAGCALGLTSMALPQPAGQDDWKIYLLLAGGSMIGAALLLSGARRQQLVLFGALAGTTLLITAGIDVSNRPTSVYALFYVGMALVAFSVLGRRAALAQVAIVAAAYGALMLHAQPPGAAERWLVTTGTVLGVGLMVGAMRRRVELLVAELSATVERLAATANTDALTGLVNRRGFDEVVGRELARMRRGGAPFALVTCDLDRFKDVNDAVGHPGGDRVLQRVAAALAGTVRGVDVVARLGGEEFGVLLPETGEAGGLTAAERLREAIESTFAGDGIPLTASCGVATADEHPTADALMRATDTALYAAKQLGRNRSVAFRPHLAAMLRLGLDAGSGTASSLRTLLTLSEAIDLRDCSTAQHSNSVARHAEAMAQALAFAPRQVARVRLAGLLHDVGRIGVADAVLRKAGPLDAAEWAEMRAHPEIGARLIGPVAGDLADWVLGHHERPDGTGYPRGLRGDEIPIQARILAVADAYEAMTADRPHRASLGAEAAARELRAGAGTQFDAHVVDTFLATLGAPSPLVAADG